MEKMITRRSADIPVSLHAAVRPATVGTTSRAASTKTELFGLQCVPALPETRTVDSTRSMKLKATWIRTVDGALVCRWINSAEVEVS
jgi:hypothetical protein